MTAEQRGAAAVSLWRKLTGDEATPAQQVLTEALASSAPALAEYGPVFLRSFVDDVAGVAGGGAYYVFDRRSPTLGNELETLAKLHADDDGVRALLRRALAIREAALGDAHPETAPSVQPRGGLLAAKGGPRGARANPRGAQDGPSQGLT